MVSGNYRCKCEGKNFGNLPNIQFGISDNYYQMVPDGYTFNAYNNHVRL